MDVATDINDSEEDSIEPCRTCGIFFTKSQDLGRAIVKPIFSSSLKDTDKNDMPDILQQLRDWNMEVAKDDGKPQYMCVACIAEFRKVLKFKRSCLEAQQEYEELEIKPFNLNIKKEIEILPEKEEKFVGFVYLSDEDSSEEDGSTRVCAVFDIPHVPIKEEHMARVPPLTVYPPSQPNESLSGDETNDADITKFDATAEKDDASDVLALDDGSSDDENIIKFTYDDSGGDDANLSLPVPLSDSTVYCKLCSYESLNQDQHLDHMHRVHLLKDCECHICGKKFVNAPESRLKYHMKWHKLQRHVKCPICGFFCNSKDALKEHNLAVHTKAQCQFCGKKMKRKMLQSHIKGHLLEREAELARTLTSTTSTATAMNFHSIIQCAFCEKTFDNTQQLQDHVLATHKTVNKTNSPSPLPISAIPVETDGVSELVPMLNNLETTSDSNNILDVSLNKTQHSELILEASSKTTSASIEMTSSTKAFYSCSICGKSFNLKIKLNRHFRKHNTEPF